MRILFANGRQMYPLFQGGDGISLHHVFTKLVQSGHTVRAVGKINPPHIQGSYENSLRIIKSHGLNSIEKRGGIDFEINGYTCHLLEHRRFMDELSQAISTYNPEIVLTQLDNSQDVIDMCSIQKKKVVLFIHDHDPLNFLCINRSKSISHVVFNSLSTSRHFKALLNCPSSIIYPPILLENYLCESRNPHFITLINPTISKGVRIAEKLAQLLPQEFFQFVKGWREPELSPEAPKNIQILERQYDMRDVYSKTKILLVPSQWEESFGRIIPEAGINRIPIVASRIGGIPEAMGSGGILIDAFNDPYSWLKEIQQLLLDKTSSEKLCKRAYMHAQKFDLELIYSQIISVLNTVNSS